ncbi:hypothetical protein [Pseudonocardia broussonetiae]|uniref:DNA-binding phage zinc finger domain-containing protein n=1 Tax=Pseudonocardia broussonetiae TaxID=2736640 RepID=A0A6M6JGR1_9PSEU|nr:hypothetical protein [Pseudonocardia broussonetiae]QJY46676.1 hypothetical protein HOP40_13305 [Pseudonocardia broussonetiae]
MNLDDVADREQAETVPCPDRPRGCGARPDEPCRNLHTGGPLQHLPAHAARLAAAGVRHAPLDPREITSPHERTPR